jgi:hypothetical protein
MFCCWSKRFTQLLFCSWSGAGSSTADHGEESADKVRGGPRQEIQREALCQAMLGHVGTEISKENHNSFAAVAICFTFPPPLLRIRIRIYRIHMFLCFLDPDPDPLVRGMDPDPDPLSNKQK